MTRWRRRERDDTHLGNSGIDRRRRKAGVMRVCAEASPALANTEYEIEELWGSFSLFLFFFDTHTQGKKE